MLKINVISFPRSGQSMNINIFKNFFKKYNFKFTFCEYYNCCRSIPCKYNYIYQKNHDFKLDIKLDNNQKYIFFYRKNKAEQLEAYYRFSQKHLNKKIDYNNKSELNDMLKFCKQKSYYYDEMMKKYYYSNNNNILCIDYNDYISNPSNIFYQMITFLDLKYTEEDVNEFFNNINYKIEKRNTLDIDIENKINCYLNKH